MTTSNTRDAITAAVKKKPRAYNKIKRLVKRALREKQCGNHHYDSAAELLKRAQQSGLCVDQPIEVELTGEDGSKRVESFVLVDNFVGECAYRNARIPHYELKKVPKFKRTSGGTSAVSSSPTAEAGV